MAYGLMNSNNKSKTAPTTIDNKIFLTSGTVIATVIIAKECVKIFRINLIKLKFRTVIK